MVPFGVCTIRRYFTQLPPEFIVRERVVVKWHRTESEAACVKTPLQCSKQIVPKLSADEYTDERRSTRSTALALPFFTVTYNLVEGGTAMVGAAFSGSTVRYGRYSSSKGVRRCPGSSHWE
jgi:hypothetical protein